MKASKVKDTDSIFDKEIRLNDIYFIKHGVIEDREFFKCLIEKGEREG